jgi:hypothetical protein
MRMSAWVLCGKRFESPAMSGNIHTLGGGRSVGGNNDGNPEPLPEAWANRGTQPRIGRIGGPSTPLVHAYGSEGAPILMSNRSTQDTGPWLRTSCFS